MSRALLLVDPQIDFITGSLPVPEAEKAMGELASHLLDNPSLYALKIITLDWHPWNHCSFEENGGLWPRHCVCHSPGASVWPGLFAAIHAGPAETVCLTKGEKSYQDEYSILQSPDMARRFSSLVKKLRIREMDVCGLAGDICVLNTLKDLRDLNLPVKINILKEYSPSLDGGASLQDYMENG